MSIQTTLLHPEMKQKHHVLYLIHLYIKCIVYSNHSLRVDAT